MGFPKTHLFLLMNTVGSMIFGMTLTTVALQADGGNENDIEAEDHSNKQADFKPEPKNLMLSLVLFTLFPSLERRQRRRRRRRRGDDENDDEAAEDLLFSAFSKTQKDLLCCHEQGWIVCISPYCEKKKRRSRRENSTVPFASRFNKKKILSYRSRESYFGASTVA